MLEYLFQPFNATRINASAINERVSVLEKDNGMQGSGKAGFWEEFEVCEAVTLPVILLVAVIILVIIVIALCR